MNGSGELGLPLLHKHQNGWWAKGGLLGQGNADLDAPVSGFEEFRVQISGGDGDQGPGGEGSVRKKQQKEKEKKKKEEEEEEDFLEDGGKTQQQYVISLLGDLPSLGPQLPIDPFRNHTPEIDGLYEWVKTIICLPLLLLRVILTALVVSIGLLGTKVAMAGWQQKLDAMPLWRYRLMIIARCCARCILFCFGFHWIRIVGSPASREEAPIVVSNHVSFTDPIFFFYALFPSMVSSNSHDSIVFVGMIIRSMQMILVDRLLPASRRKAALEIKRRALCNDFPRVLLFPEGTTTNNRALISFKLGAFGPGLPVQPVVVRYPFVHFDCSWGNISLPKLVFRMLTQFNNFMEVEYLPVIVPSPREKDNPAEFAARVRFEMASVLNVPVTEHAYGDLMLAVKATQLKMSSASASMIEMGRMEKLFNLSTDEVKDYFDKFVAMDPSRSGHVNLDQFLEAISLPKTEFSKQIFRLFDKSERGFINFREFVAVLGFLSRHAAFSSLVKSAFEACDLDKGGSVSLTELERRLKSVFPLIPHSKVEQLFQKLDIDGDQVISWDDFEAYLGKNPELLTVFLPAKALQVSE